MKLIKVERAKAIWLFQTSELNPRGLDLVPMVSAVKNRYKFFGHPKTPEELFGNAQKFDNGAFTIQDGRSIGVQALTFFSDGIVAETQHSTDATDDFLADLMSFSVKSFGVEFADSMVLEKRYLSELTVKSDCDLDAVSDKFLRFSQVLTGLDPLRSSYSASGMHFSTDPEIPSSTMQFRFERRVTSRASERQFFTQAPLSTANHIKAFEALESIFSS